MSASSPLALFAGALGLFFALVRCSGEGTCLRNSDCERGHECRAGTCQLPPAPGDGGTMDAAVPDDAEAGLPDGAAGSGAGSGGSGGAGAGAPNGGGAGEAGEAGAAGHAGEGGAAGAGATGS